MWKIFKRKNYLITGFALIGLILSNSVYYLSRNVDAAGILAIVGQVLSTGTGPFDPNDDPGNDSSASNNILRNLDTVNYQFDYSLNGGNDTNVRLSSTLPSYLDWVNLPSQCLTAGVNPISYISADRKTFVCNVGSVNGGTTSNLQVTAKLRGETPHGTTLNISADVIGDTSAGTSSNTLTTISSAAPKVDLRKNYTARGPAYKLGEDGVTPGLINTFFITMLIEGGKGNEALVPNFTIIDDLSAYSPNSQLYSWDSEYSGGCYLNGPPASSLQQLPYGYNGSTPNDQQVGHQGNWVCSQPLGPGNPIEIDVTGADTSGNHLPARDVNGDLLPFGEYFVAAEAIVIWTPLSDIEGQPDNTLDVINSVAFESNPLSVSGNPNYGVDGEPASNNSQPSELRIVTAANYDKGFVNVGRALLPTASSYRSGDAVVVPGQVFLASPSFSNTGTTNITNATICDKIDNTKLNIVDDVEGSPVEIYNINFPAEFAYTVEFGTGGYTSYEDMRDTTCDDEDSPGGWHTSISTVPGGISAITKVRITAPLLEPGDSMGMYIFVKALNNPIGTIIPNFANFKSEELEGGNWLISDYDPVNHTGNRGDRVTLTKALVRILKKTLPNDSVSTVDAGKKVTYELSPSVNLFSGIPDQADATDITVTDTLPAELSYINLSANIEPNSITNNPDGTTTLVWNIGTYSPGEVIPPITFEALTSIDTSNNMPAMNRVVISSPEDLSNESYRTALREILITSPATLMVSKTSQNPIAELDEDLIYSLNYRNASSIAFVSTDFIDILPFNGDSSLNSRSDQPSDFTGTISFESVSGENGEVFQFTKRASSQISEDPNDVSNQSGGATVWCTTLSGGFCPANNSEITAVRIIGGVYPSGETSRSVTLVLSPDGNAVGDIYTNTFVGRTPSLSLPVYSLSTSTAITDQSISGFVYYDQNNNGIKDSGEAGISGVTLTLSGISDEGDIIELNATTDVNGYYIFSGIPLSDIAGYTINETQPSGYADGLDSIGSSGGNLGNDVISEILLDNGEVAINYNFGEIIISAVTPTPTSIPSPTPTPTNVPIATIVPITATPAPTVVATSTVTPTAIITPTQTPTVTTLVNTGRDITLAIILPVALISITIYLSKDRRKMLDLKKLSR